MKRLSVFVITMLLGASLAFAQQTGSDKTGSTGQPTDKSDTSKKGKKGGKKGHKGGKKSKKGASDTTGGGTTPQPK